MLRTTDILRKSLGTVRARVPDARHIDLHPPCSWRSVLPYEIHTRTEHPSLHPTVINTRPCLKTFTFCRQLHSSPAIKPHLWFTPASSFLNFSRLKYSPVSTTRLKGLQNSFSTQSENKSPVKEKSGDSQDPPSDLPIRTKNKLSTRESVNEFLSQLTEEQKQLLYHSLNVDVLRDKYETHLGSSKSESHEYLSRFGRPTVAVGKEDPTGTLCEAPPEWLDTRLDDKTPRPLPAGAVWAVGLKNALPFIGFGFLDNLIMIVAGDYIDITIGTTLGISTMAAAALGNTISDVAGIGSAWYIEDLANKIGLKEPPLTPSQMASGSIRWACNIGRAIGVIIGCLLGMIPLLFLETSEDLEKDKTEASKRRRNHGGDKEIVDKGK